MIGHDSGSDSNWNIMIGHDSKSDGNRSIIICHDIRSAEYDESMRQDIHVCNNCIWLSACVFV